VLIGAHRCDKQPKKPKREELVNRSNKRERKDNKRGHKQQQQQDREKRARMEVEDEEKDEDNMMDTDQIEDVSVVGTRTFFYTVLSRSISIHAIDTMLTRIFFSSHS